MIGPLVLWLFAVTAKQDQTPLREACGDDEPVVAHLAAGTPVEIRFALSDGSGCYKVTAGEVAGYVTAGDLTGLEEFDRQRRGGRTISDSGDARPAQEPPKVAVHTSDPRLGRVVELLDANKPTDALQALQPFLKERKRNPSVLVAAGMAAYKLDDLRGALDYWRESLDQQPDAQLEAFYKRVEREASNDSGKDKLYGYRFQLRYEGTEVPAETARQMVSVLDDEFTRVSGELGCPADERIPVIVQSREAYLKTTGAAEWSGGQYDGRIHAALVEGSTIGPATRRLFAHEIVHACLANMGQWPAWLHEGLAQKLSGDTLSSGQRAAIDELIHAHSAPRLEALARGWSHLDAAHAHLAYALALAAADALYEDYSAYGIVNILRNPGRLPQITAELDRRLGL